MLKNCVMACCGGKKGWKLIYFCVRFASTFNLLFDCTLSACPCKKVERGNVRTKYVMRRLHNPSNPVTSDPIRNGVRFLDDGEHSLWKDKGQENSHFPWLDFLTSSPCPTLCPSQGASLKRIPCGVCGYLLVYQRFSYLLLWLAPEKFVSFRWLIPFPHKKLFDQLRPQYQGIPFGALVCADENWIYQVTSLLRMDIKATIAGRSVLTFRLVDHHQQQEK